MTSPTLQRAMKAIDGTVDFRDGWMTPESAERTVRAVLMAVREPDEVIISDDAVWACALAEDAGGTWRAMIDAILNDGESE